MAMPASLGRDKNGRFATKRRLQWKENLVISCKRRKVRREYIPECISEGRRIVELAKLAEEMWCRDCDVPLSFRYVQRESRIGLASVFTIMCHVCLVLLDVHTSKWNYGAGISRRQYAVNLKSAVALLDGGIGTTHLNTILSELNIPTVTDTLTKRCERIVGTKIEEVAKDSCREALQLEKQLTISEECSENIRKGESGEEEGQNEGSNSPTQIKVSFDAGWQKKGSGRSYNSLTGHGIAIGSRSGKLVGYATRNKRCTLCERGHLPNEHDCRVNHTGSSKSMEPQMAVEIVTKNPMLQEENVQIGTIIGDDDSSTIANVRREAHHPVDKESDKNHATCTLSKDMWSLKIPKKIIEYMKYCFGCVLLKNKGNVEKVRAGLLNIVPHAFGDHEKCGAWCGYKKDPINYTHKLLPGGKSLTDPNMKSSLTTIFKKFAANAEKLAPCGSTQANEAFHTIVASKAPKSRHYGGSESNDFRVAAAVCQKNYGTSYVMTIHEKLDISPGKNTATFREKKDQVREAQRKHAQTTEAKRRRRSLFHGHQSNNNKAENREGITYSSGCGLNAIVEVDAAISLQNEVIPCAVSFVFYDLETTGLDNTSEIVQISGKRGTDEFNAYILPTHEISRGASLITGLTVENGELHLNGQQVETIPRRVAMLRFLEFLKPGPGPIILVAHNGRRFDTPKLLKELQSLHLMDEFREIVCGFCDSLPVLKTKLHERVKAKQSFRLSVLAEQFIGADASAGAHNGSVDVRMLEDVIRVVGVTDEELRAASLTIGRIFVEEAQKAKTKSNKSTFDCITQGVSAGMKTKMAQAGLTFDHLKKSFLDGGEAAVTVLLASDVDGRPRVTKNKKIIENIITQVTNVIEKP